MDRNDAYRAWIGGLVTDDGGPDEDTALVVAAQRGDGAAFLRLADRYRPRIIGSLARTADPRAVALDELAQQALDDAYEGLPRLRNPGNFRSWLFTIARRRLLDALDAQAHEIPLDNLLVPPTTPAPEPPSDLLDMAVTALGGGGDRAAAAACARVQRRRDRRAGGQEPGGGGAGIDPRTGGAAYTLTRTAKGGH